MAAESVLVEGKFGLAKVLKPPANFEGIYQGRNAIDDPIALPGTLDFQAGKPGFDANLLAGIPVPLGSQLLLWFPAAYTSEGLSMPAYNWRILWRLRTTLDTVQATTSENQRGLSGHQPTAVPGVQDDANVRLVIPCGLTSVKFTQTEPAGTADVINKIRGEQIQVEGNSYDASDAPFLMNGQRGIASQGVYDDLSTDNGRQGGPTYMPYVTPVLGDEFFLIVGRGGGAANWDFAGPDRLFSRIFGTDNGSRQPIPGLGVFAMTGTRAT